MVSSSWLTHARENSLDPSCAESIDVLFLNRDLVQGGVCQREQIMNREGKEVYAEPQAIETEQGLSRVGSRVGTHTW